MKETIIKNGIVTEDQLSAQVREQLFIASYYKQLSEDIGCTIIRLEPVFFQHRDAEGMGLMNNPCLKLIVHGNTLCLLRVKAFTLPNYLFVVQGMIFFLAGFETTAHSMGVLCYLLVKNPEVV